MKKKLTKPKPKTKKSLPRTRIRPVSVNHIIPFPQGDAFTAIQIVQALAADRHATQREEPEGTEPEYAASVCNGKRWMSLDTILNPVAPDRSLVSEIKTISRLGRIRGFFVVNLAKVVVGFRKLFRRNK